MKTQQSQAYKQAFGYICEFRDGVTQDALFETLEEINKSKKTPIERDRNWIDIPERERLIQKGRIFDHEVEPEVYREVVEKTLTSRLLGQADPQSLHSMSIELGQRQIFMLGDYGLKASLLLDEHGPRIKISPIEN